MVGIAVDSGYLFYTRRTMQTAADSAALAGSLDKSYETSTTATVTAAAKSDAALNGFSEDGDTTVTVNSPPQNGSFQTGDYVEVIIEKRNITAVFMNFLGFDSSTVKARAVAGAGDLTECIWATSPTGTGLSVQGGASIDLPSCGIYVRSSDTASALSTGNPVKANGVDVVGKIDHPANVTAYSPGVVTQGAATLPDPLSGTTVHKMTGCSGNPTGGTITPNNTTPYCSIKISGSFAFSPGTYYINGDTSSCGSGSSAICLQLNTTGVTSRTITGNGVTFYVAGGGIQVQGKGAVTLSAPSTGTYAGFVLLEAPGNTNTVDIKSPSGDGCKALTGVVYAASGAVQYNAGGCGTTPAATLLVAKTISLAGQAIFGQPPITLKKRGHSHLTE
jgi:hypothetical protein